MGRCTRVNILTEIFQEVNRQKDLKMEEKGESAHDFTNDCKGLYKRDGSGNRKAPHPIGCGAVSLAEFASADAGCSFLK